VTPVSWKGYALRIPLLFILLLLFPLLSDAAPSSGAYLSRLLDTSKKLDLHQERYWEILLHYKKGFRGIESLIDDPKFFLSTKGKIDPGAELEATINFFFQEFNKEEEFLKCRFPARYEWLKEKLNVDESKLPTVSCTEFDDALSKVDPRSAVLVFPAAYMNSPASMFGHTLIRLDSTYESKLLSYSVSYAATTDDTNGLAFAFKGIFGYYPGNYSILPYYDKVKQYNNMDQRDIWEYELDLTEEEVRRMFFHIWELKDIYSDYFFFFFDENCAFELLFLLESARPSLNLTGDFFYWVIPVDTIKVVNKSNIVKTVKYRPAISTRIKHLLNNLDLSTQKLALKVAKGDIPPEDILTTDIEKQKKILVLDLSTEIIQYQYSKGKQKKGRYKKSLLDNLAVRSSLGKAVKGTTKVPEPSRPENSHKSGRLSMGIGIREDLSFAEIKYRPAYQTLSEPDEGYTEGSQIVFAGLSVRYYEENDLRLDRLDVIDLFSLSPRNSFFKPMSWKVITGIKSKTFSENNQHHIYYVNPGFGVAYKNDIFGLYYAMIESDIEVGSDLDKDYAVSLGISAGIVKKITNRWKINLTAKAVTYELGDEHQSKEIKVTQNFEVNKNNSISLDYSMENIFHITTDEFKINWNLYF
jgi:hypothetical protein